jgi:mxaJ protein
MYSRFRSLKTRLERRHPCMHERRFDAKRRRPTAVAIRPSFTPLKPAALQARMPAVQSVDLALKSILIAIVLLMSSCASPRPMVEQKQYIDPPKQKKIPAATTALRVCADPNNLPFSNNNGDGFENKIAELIADDMNLPLEYTWWAQRRGFFRNTLRDGLCDVVIGVPASFELAATTAPYYRSTYVFVSRSDRHIDVRSFDDARLRDLKIGVQLVGDDGANTPPVHALNNRGMIDNIKGYTLYGDYKDESPPSRVLDAVEKREVDIAVVWGPFAGYYSQHHPGLQIDAVSPEIDLPYLPFVYDISVGVRRGEDELRTRIDEILARRRADVKSILDRYGVPRATEVNSTRANEPAANKLPSPSI